MTRSCINICLLAVISLLFGVIWQGPACAAMPTMTDLGQISGPQINGTFREATALALDSVGNLYVSDTRARVIFKYDVYGDLVATISVPSLKGEGLAVAADGRIFVSVSTAGIFADKVVILDQAGVEIGALGQGTDEFKMAGDIDFDVNGNVYVVDRTDGIVKTYSGALTSGARFGAVQYGGTVNMAIDPVDNEIYIANYSYDNGAAPTLYIYDSGANLLRTILAVNGFGGDDLSSFGDVAFDNFGRFYVSDATLHSIRVLDKPASQTLKYTAGIRKATDMVYDAATRRLFVLRANSGVDIIGIDGGTTPPPPATNTTPSVPVPVTVGEVTSLTPDLVFNNSIDGENDSLTYNLQVLGGATPVTFSVVEGADPTTAVVNVPLIENASYTWQVQADDGLLTSAWSAPQAIYVNATQEAPSAFSLTSFLGGQDAGSDAILSWNASIDTDPFSSVSYRVEISDTSVVTSTDTAATSAALTGLSANLVPGANYTWRVVAVDTPKGTDSSNSGSFIYRPSVLRVSSNVPGATAYLSGHHGYAGRLLGTAPVEVRDLAAGKYSLVVEAAGFEPSVTRIEVFQDIQTDVVAELKGARLATTFAARGLNLAGQAVSGVNVTPIVADLDQDGVLDLILADNGFINFYKGSLAIDPLAADTIEDLNSSTVPTERVVFSTAVQQLAVPQIAGATPCLVDWNNDDKLDLLIGDADGSVQLFLGLGGLNFPAVADETLINVSGQAIPAVADVDGDGAKDLVIATPTELLLIANVGTDSAPLLGGQSTMALLTAPAAPIFSDWNADGTRNLMLISEGELFQTDVSGGVVTAMNSTGLVVAGADRVFALSFAGSSYTDLVFATSTGSLVAVNGQQGGFAPAYKQALLTKLAEVEQEVLLQAPELIGKVANIASRIGRGKYASAAKKAEQLEVSLVADTPAGIVVGELVGLLK